MLTVISEVLYKVQPKINPAVCFVFVSASSVNRSCMVSVFTEPSKSSPVSGGFSDAEARFSKVAVTF